MSDTLKELEVRLNNYKCEYQQLKKEFTDITSECGIEITAQEEADLDYICRAITGLEKEIEKRLELYSTISMQAIFNEYDTLEGDLRNELELSLVNSFIKKGTYVTELGTCYTEAVNNFTSTVEAHNAYVSNLNAIYASLFSVAGIGVLAIFSTTNLLAKQLAKVSKMQEETLKSIINVGEDIAQAGLDKVVSYSYSKQDEAILERVGNLPLVFQNNLSGDLSKDYLIARNLVLDQLISINKCKKAINQYIKGNKGNPKEEYEKFLKFEKNTGKTLNACRRWANNNNLTLSNPKELTLDFERTLWSKWLPRLEGTRQSSGGNYSNHNTSIDYDDNFSSALSNRLDSLLNLNTLCDKEGCIEEGGLSFIVSDNDVKLLVNWAKNFTMPTNNF